MKNNIEYIDDKIRELTDFKPKVEPDWEQFFAKNQHELEGLKTGAGNTSSAKHVTSSGIKYSLILISVIALFITGYFFYTADDKTQNIPTEELPETQINSSKEVIVPNQSIDENLSNTSSTNNDVLKIETIKNSTLDAGKQKSEIPSQVIEVKDENHVVKENPSDVNTSGDSSNNKPVIIRKTIVIDDTVKLKLPVGK